MYTKHQSIKKIHHDIILLKINFIYIYLITHDLVLKENIQQIYAFLL